MLRAIPCCSWAAVNARTSMAEEQRVPSESWIDDPAVQDVFAQLRMFEADEEALRGAARGGPVCQRVGSSQRAGRQQMDANGLASAGTVDMGSTLGYLHTRPPSIKISCSQC